MQLHEVVPGRGEAQNSLWRCLLSQVKVRLKVGKGALAVDARDRAKKSKLQEFINHHVHMLYSLKRLLAQERSFHFSNKLDECDISTFLWLMSRRVSNRG